MSVAELAILGGVGLAAAGWVLARKSGLSGSQNVLPDFGARPFPGYTDLSRAFTISTRSTWDSLYTATGERYDIDPRLLRAIAQQESGENAFAVGDQHLPNGPSVGLMQILATGWPGAITRKLNGIEGWPPLSGNLLMDPEYNLSIAAQLLVDARNRYGRTNIEKVLADYNGGPRRAAEWPNHRNRSYTDSVLDKYDALVADAARETRVL